MSEDWTEEYEVLEKEISEIGERSRERHREIFLRNVDHPVIVEALENILSYWRYNIRAALTQFSYEAVGGKGSIPSVYVEFCSVAGAGVGIHDDIIDRTFLKRDRRTIPALYGLPVALTVGDLLIVKGLTFIRETLDDKEVTSKVLKAYEDFFTEMCIGEVMEIHSNKNLDLSLKAYHDMLWKLGVDAEFCTRIGAIIGGGTDSEVDALSRFGRIFGYLCRLHDELDDMVNLEAKLGYRIEFESIPLPILFASKKSSENYELINETLRNRIGFEELAKLFKLSWDSGSFNYIKNIANQNSNKSISILEKLGDNDSSNKLGLTCRKLSQDIEKKIG